MTVLLTDDEGNTGYGETQFIVEAARKHALNEETVRKQVDRLGTTEYELSDLVLSGICTVCRTLCIRRVYKRKNVFCFIAA